MEFDADARKLAQAHVDEHGFLSWLGLTIEELSEDRVVMRVPYEGKLANHSPGGEGNVHGGIAATLIDTAAGFACRTALEDPVNDGLATIDLNVSYLRPATDDLVAEATLVRAGGSVGVATVTVESDPGDGEWTTVAVGRASYRLFRE